MKKMLIGMAVGAAALGATVVPASAGTGNMNPWALEDAPTSTIWEVLVGGGALTEGAEDYDETEFGLSDLVLIAGLGSALDTCGNGKPQYTLIAPAASILTYLLSASALQMTVADLAETPDLARALLNDHLVNGSFSPEQLLLSKVLVARSGYRLNIQKITSIYDVDGLAPATLYDYYINGNQIINHVPACNGWIYTILGFINSKSYIESEGMNALDTPQDGTPGGTNSLPNTL